MAAEKGNILEAERKNINTLAAVSRKISAAEKKTHFGCREEEHFGCRE
jgi:hypothetical protein